MTQTYILIHLLLLTTLAALAQTDTTIKRGKYHFWLTSASHETFSGDIDFLIGGQLGFNFSVNQRYFFQLKGYECFSLNSFPFSESTPDRLVCLKNLSALYGLGQYRTNSFLIITSAGLSYGKVTYRGKLLYIDHPTNCFVCWDTPVYEYNNYFYFGLPLNVSFMLTSPVIG